MKKIIVVLISFFIFLGSFVADGVPVNEEVNEESKTANAEYASGSKSAILMETSTKTVLYEKNAHEKLAPASMTKVMTMLLAMEAIESGRIKLSDKVLISKNAAGMGGTQIFVEANTEVKIEDLLKGIGIASANDAAVAIAEKIGGTEDNFIDMMNKRAKELGAVDTNFKNPHGLDEVNHYTTAYDLALIATELVKHKNILKITSTYEEYINVSGENHWLVNTNSLVRFYKGMDGLKTGYTDQAKYCLTSTMEKNNMRLVGVVMGSDTKEARNTDTINMMEYGFGMYNTKTIIKSNKKLGTIYINNSRNRNVSYYAENDVNILIDANTKDVDYKMEKELYDNVKSPLKKGDVVGELILTYNKKEYKYNLVVKENIKKAGFIRMLYNNFKDIISGKVGLI